jgi:uncharacterized protein (DUF4415 family)
MKQTSITKQSAAIDPLDPDEAPPLTRDFFKNAEYRIANKKVTKAEWQKAAREQHAATLSKKRISIMLDGAIIEYFKAAAGERGYQTLINDALRKAIAGEQMVNEVRHVVREELAAYSVKK